MIVCKRNFCNTDSYGASVLEVLLSLAIIALATPFIYAQISKTNSMLRDISVAKKIMSSRDTVLNFVRMNQDKWPNVAQIQMDSEDLNLISPDAEAGFIDKYLVNGASITDVYLAFSAADNDIKSHQVARHIGDAAAIVGPDGIAYGKTWAVAAPEFISGDLIYRVSRDVSGEDTSKFLHRATTGQDGLNVMFRDLNMARHNVYGVSSVSAKDTRVKNINTSFIKSEDVVADNIYFSSGVNMDGEGVFVDNIRVTGDINGFRNIAAKTVNGTGYTTSGHIITDRATVSKSVNVAKDFVLKSDSGRTISGFTGVSASSVMVPYVFAEEMIFYDNFGLTVSGELLMSTTVPLKLGGWGFPSVRPPEFKKLTLSRAKIPDAPNANEFKELLRDDWQINTSGNILVAE